jgi:hypothetical protein
MNTAAAAVKFADVCPDAEGAVLIGESLDNFRQLAMKPGFPKAFKIGHMNFRNRKELQAFKRQRDAARKVK